MCTGKCGSQDRTGHIHKPTDVRPFYLYLFCVFFNPLKVQACCPGHTPQLSGLSVRLGQ